MSNRIGVSNKVLAPWTPLRVGETAARCWGREYAFGASPLPEKIRSAGRSLLAGPMRIAGHSSGRELDWRADGSEFTAATPAKATWHWRGTALRPVRQAQGRQAQDRPASTMKDHPEQGRGAAGRVKLDCRAQIEFDGMIRVDVRIGAKGTKLDDLMLEIPIKAQYARYIHYSDGTRVSDARGTGGDEWRWRSSFVPYVWLGDEERGLAWFAESDEGWQPGDAGAAITVDKAGSIATLQLHLLDQPVALERPLCLTFGLQATPVKPVPARYHRMAHVWHGCEYGMENEPAPDGNGTTLDYLARQGVRTVVFHQHWTEYYGLPITRENGDKLTSLVQACHQRGLKFLLYYGYGLADLSPEGRRFHDDMAVMPIIRWEGGRGAVDAFDAFCARSAYADFLLWGMERTISEHDIDGVYFDGTSQPWRCANRRHGCGYVAPSGERKPTYPIFAARDLIRRAYTLFRARKRDSIINVHMSAHLTIPTLSFADSYWDGEQFSGLEHGERAPVEVLPLDAFRAEFMGKQYGLAAEFLVDEHRAHAFTTREALALTMLHDVLVRPRNLGESLRLIGGIWKAREDFGAPKARWIPYWQPHSPARSDRREIMVSLHSRPGRGALLVVANLGAAATAKVRLDLAALQLPARAHATDALTGERLSLRGGVLSFPLSRMDWRLVRIEPAPGR